MTCYFVRLHGPVVVAKILQLHSSTLSFHGNLLTFHLPRQLSLENQLQLEFGLGEMVEQSSIAKVGSTRLLGHYTHRKVHTIIHQGSIKIYFDIIRFRCLPHTWLNSVRLTLMSSLLCYFL
ncbi:hypothetical protein M6B38_295330 [Iris pallida]|uniref:Uncharacterized protein n=1 Tax=Iris pallida TaxID=29817 RepID=A0AAX6HSY0_IRIPA|nr:hypothetical protein M6B38_295330 [Iris pallida]